MNESNPQVPLPPYRNLQLIVKGSIPAAGYLGLEVPLADGTWCSVCLSVPPSMVTLLVILWNVMQLEVSYPWEARGWCRPENLLEPLRELGDFMTSAQSIRTGVCRFHARLNIAAEAAVRASGCRRRDTAKLVVIERCRGSGMRLASGEFRTEFPPSETDPRPARPPTPGGGVPAGGAVRGLPKDPLTEPPSQPSAELRADEPHRRVRRGVPPSLPVASPERKRLPPG